jgi:flagellin-like hook-associated protein FlgL
VFRFTRALNTLNVSVGNLTAGPANIKNKNVAEEITELTKQQLLVQSSAAMLGQENLI